MHPFNEWERFYLKENPYDMESERQQVRFKETNRIILENFGQAYSLLEYGGGEGYQTKHLLKIANHVTSVDPSKLAIRRAKKRAPQADFIVGTIADYIGTFDLVCAFEVLYYTPQENILSILKNLESQGNGVIISYWRKRDFLDKFFEDEKYKKEIIYPPNGLPIQLVWWNTN